MPVTINASPSNGLVQTADGSGIIKVQSNGVTTNALAWVNFNGTTASPSTIRSSYNVTSVTKNTTGDYTVNFTNALSDANYSCIVSGGRGDGAGVTAGWSQIYSSAANAYTSLTTTTARVSSAASNGTALDFPVMCVAIFGN